MHNIYMHRCIELALLGQGMVAPNPLVGCVIVYNNTIIGEGWHMQFGKPHAEVNAILSVKEKHLLPKSTLYVNLEPCCHYGKTPPCSRLIIENGIKHVVIGMVDPNPLVAGNGIAMLEKAGVKTETGILESECKFLNRRFIHYITQKKPFVILKWAQTINGMLAPDANLVSKDTFEKERHITGKVVQRLVHKWRTYEDAIMVGTNTMITDNPQLNARQWHGNNPIRITIDKRLTLNKNLHIFDNTQPTIIFNLLKDDEQGKTRYIKINEVNILDEILNCLYQLNIQSLIVEGGAKLLNSFIDQKKAQEVIVFTSQKHISKGIKAPCFEGNIIFQTYIDKVMLTQYTL